MKRRVKAWLLVFAVFGLMVGLARPATAATWAVIENGDCTGVGDATSSLGDATTSAWCCTGVDNGFCSRRGAGGDLFAYNVTLVADGTYTAGGDALTAAQLGKIGLDTFVDWSCDLATIAAGTTVLFPVIERTDARKGTEILLFTATATQAVGAIDGHTLNCTVSGY